MRLKIFSIYLSASFVLGLLFSTFPHSAAAEQLPDSPYATIDQLAIIFGNIVSVVAVIGGFLAFIALIVGGFRYLTSQGDPKAIAAAQGTVTWAFLGLAAIIIAWLVLVFIEQFTGIPITKFTIVHLP